MKKNGSYGLPISMCLGVVLDHNGEEDNEDDTDDKQRAYKSVFAEVLDQTKRESH